MEPQSKPAQRQSPVNTIICPDGPPPKPDPEACRGCGAVIEPVYLPPVKVLDTILAMSNRWVFESEYCQRCEVNIRAQKEMDSANERLAAEEIKKAEMEASLEKMIGRRGMTEFTFKSFNASLANNDAYKAMFEFNPERENLFVWGPAGVGKSHLACASMRSFYMSGIPSVFVKHSKLNRSMQGLMSDDYDKRLKHYVESDVLVVDDLGTAKRTEFSDQVLYDVLDGRYMAYRQGLIITSNISLKDLALVLGDDRLTSRIAGMCKVVHMPGEDWRLKKR